MIKKKEMQIYSSMLTDKGERRINEDFAYSLQVGNSYYFILCDGLGGHGNGNVASRFVVEQMKTNLWHMPMEDAIQKTQDALLEKQRQENAEDSMKTTLVCLEIIDGIARFAHVGDSRLYLFENGRYKLRSLDHSVPQMLVNNGSILEKDIRKHEDRSKLLRVMGTKWSTPQYQVSDTIDIGKKTSFLLCSDGFWELIDEKMMGKTLKRASTPAEWLSEMEKIVLENGRNTNMDNYTAIAVYIR